MAESSLLLLSGEIDVFVDLETLLRIEDEAPLLEFLMELRLFGFNILPLRSLRSDDFDFNPINRRLGFPLKLRKGDVLAYLEVKFHHDSSNILQNGTVVSFIGKLKLPFFPRSLLQLKNLETFIVQVDQGCEIEMNDLDIRCSDVWRLMINYGRRSWPSSLEWISAFKNLKKLVLSIQGGKKYRHSLHPFSLCGLKKLKIAKLNKVDLTIDHSDISLQRLTLVNSKLQFAGKPLHSLKTLEMRNCVISIDDLSSLAPNLIQLRLGHMRGYKGMGIANLPLLRKLSLTQVRLIYPR